MKSILYRCFISLCKKFSCVFAKQYTIDHGKRGLTWGILGSDNIKDKHGCKSPWLLHTSKRNFCVVGNQKCVYFYLDQSVSLSVTDGLLIHATNIHWVPIRCQDLLLVFGNIGIESTRTWVSPTDFLECLLWKDWG